MSRSVPSGAKSAWGFFQAVFTTLGGVSLLAWAYAVVTSKDHHPLDFWLVVALALLLVAAVIWGARRGKPNGGSGVIIHMEGGDIINQVAPGTLPPGAPEDPSAARGKQGK